MRASLRALAAVATATLYCTPTIAQTYSNCNPITQGVGSCSADTALGKSVDIDFTSASDSFTTSGAPTYGSDGASFTIAQEGDAPMLTSKWYIMFGKVELVAQAAPGVGIVSSFVLQSDDLDEIDYEWVGCETEQVQSNYFGKGQTTTYNRGALHSAPGSQTGFHTYTIDWTADEIVWQVDGTTVRALKPADANNQYPQTPMQIKIGAWAGGDPSNAAGTISWACGTTDYSAGPYTMKVKSVSVQDYSTGTQYKYGDTSGTWESIQAVGGSVNSNGDGTQDSSAPAITSTSGGPAYVGSDSAASVTTVTPTTWPYVPYVSTVAPASVAASNYPGLPSGWTVTSSGKVIPPSSAPSTSLPASSSSSPAVSPQALPSAGGSEVITTYDDKGFLTTMTVPAGWQTVVKSYNEQGFPITAAPTSTPAAALQAEAVSTVDGAGGSLLASSTTKAAPTGAATRSASFGLPLSFSISVLVLILFL